VPKSMWSTQNSPVFSCARALERNIEPSARRVQLPYAPTRWFRAGSRQKSCMILLPR
jgi:hypothetical protein